MNRYHMVHEPDVANFELPEETHRLPGISAADALNNPADDAPPPLCTGLEDLDSVLADIHLDSPSNAISLDPSVKVDGKEENKLRRVGGLPLGQVTEVWGPPGSGKTTFGIQVAANALIDKRFVMWVDCNSPLWTPRLIEVLNQRYRTLFTSSLDKHQPSRHQNINNGETQEDEEDGPEEPDFPMDDARLSYHLCSSLAHIVALLVKPNPLIIPKDLALVVIDGLTVLINNTYPRNANDNQKARGPKDQGPSARRLQVIQSLVGGLQKLAATHKCAVLLLSQCATKMESGRGATLTPAINGTVWEQAITTRLGFFKDWVWQRRESEDDKRGYHDFEEITFIAVQKLQGTVLLDAMQHMLGFKVESTGLISVTGIKRDKTDQRLPRQGKRKLDDTGFEVPDSDAEDEYGWDERYNEFVPRPSQWQGSEDLIMDPHRHQEEELDEEEEGQETNDIVIHHGELPSESLITQKKITDVLREIPSTIVTEYGDSEDDDDDVFVSGSFRPGSWMEAVVEQEDTSQSQQVSTSQMVLGLDLSGRVPDTKSKTTKGKSKIKGKISSGNLARRPKR